MPNRGLVLLYNRLVLWVPSSLIPSSELLPTRKGQPCREVGTDRLTIRTQVALCCRRDGRI